MKLLVVGDIVGKPGLDKLNERLLTTIREQNIDFCIVNGENSANGKGIRLQEYNAILNYGADAITMGNHIYYRKEMAEEYIKLDRLVLPANITNLNGNKYVIVEKNGIKLAVIQLLGGVEMGKIFEENSISPFKSVIEQIEIVKDKADYIIVDFHAEATAEKIAMGYYLEDKANLVFGTHTHVQTADETIFDTGMAYITDIGMTRSQKKCYRS